MAMAAQQDISRNPGGFYLPLLLGWPTAAEWIGRCFVEQVERGSFTFHLDLLWKAKQVGLMHAIQN